MFPSPRSSRGDDGARGGFPLTQITSSMRSDLTPQARRDTTPSLHHLAAQFAAGVRRGVDVGVPFAGQQVGGLIVGQGGAALDRALHGLEGKCDAGVLAGFSRTMEMRAHRRARKVL